MLESRELSESPDTQQDSGDLELLELSPVICSIKGLLVIAIVVIVIILGPVMKQERERERELTDRCLLNECKE